MKLTSEQAQVLIQKLERLLKNDCKHCGSREWLVNDRVFEMKEFDNFPVPKPENNTVFPVAVVTCKQCGTAHFYSAVILGLLEKKL
jgi:predicted nucleic-acid-binding Zn-ribbon protein